MSLTIDLPLLFLQPDYYRDAPHFRRIGEGPQYRLEIPHAKLDFTGAYSVLAKNEHGEAKAVISLQIYAKGMPLILRAPWCKNFH